MENINQLAQMAFDTHKNGVLSYVYIPEKLFGPGYGYIPTVHIRPQPQTVLGIVNSAMSSGCCSCTIMYGENSQDFNIVRVQGSPVLLWYTPTEYYMLPFIGARFEKFLDLCSEPDSQKWCEFWLLKPDTILKTLGSGLICICVIEYIHRDYVKKTGSVKLEDVKLVLDLEGEDVQKLINDVGFGEI